MSTFNVLQEHWRSQLPQAGSNADFSRVHGAIVSHVVAYTLLVSILLEQRIRKYLFVGTTGFYLTFKFTSVIQKVRLLVFPLRALSRKELHYGSSASTEQVTAAGDLCAICQEKLRSPIVLQCKHIFCEECVSEWFDRERTCPLCRALVKPADIKSYSDGSTSLFFQFF